MEILIDNKRYTINENEYNKIQHKEYNNLRLYDNIGLHERIIGFIKKCKEVYSIYNPDFISCNTKYGGFIPINVSNNFNHICLVDTKNTHETNILENIKNHHINNIDFHHDGININKIIYSEEVNNIIEQQLTHQSIILITKDNNFRVNSYQFFCLSGTDYYIYVSENLVENFTNLFHYHIGDEINGIRILNFDNLMNLCIMVKNGGSQFEQMLIDNLHIIDTWTILDTGSTDKTMEIINRVLVGKKEGQLYQEPFINFRESRNRLLDLAGTSCKYNIMLDDTYVVKGKLREFLTEVRSDQYSNSFTLYIKSDDTIYGSNRIIRSDSGLRYIHTIHEVITDKNNINVVIPEERAFIFDKRFDYMEKRTMERKQLDLKLLYEEVEENPNDPRAYYYLAQTYNLLEDYENAYKYFLKRAEFTNSGFIQERVDALFEAARVANFKLNKPWPECEELYNRCFKVDESRPEALYFIGIHYYLENNFKKAYPFFKKAFQIGFPQHCQYSLKPTLSYHFLPKFLSRICYELEDYNLGLAACELFLLHNNNASDGYSEILSWCQIFQKLTMFSGEKKVKIPEKPILCFVADGGFNQWAGSNILTSGVGGSETYIIEMARYIKQNDFFGEVIVFCNTPGENDEIFEGVLYKHINNYYEFINTNYVHTCIISRFSEYLPVTFKGFSENVYLVVHDLTPSGIIIPMDKKLKNIFCLTEWHVDYFTNIFPSLKNITVPFYYGIDNKFKINDVNSREIKIKNKFIYSSFPNRGLLELLQMWPKIIEKVPTSTLYIYSDVNNKWSNNVEPQKMQQIRDLLASMCDTKYGIQYHGWVSKKELAYAWLTSDIWFYPCTFMETFCLTALEAASSKTFVVTNHLAALQNTVGNRGCIIKGNPTTKEWQEEALDKLFYYIVNGENHVKKKQLIDENYAWATTLTWEIQAQKMLNKYILPNRTNDIIKIIETICSFKLDCENDYHILKIGAFKGNVPNDTLFSKINSKSKVIFVEPVPSYYYELKDNYNKKFTNNSFIYLNNAVSNKEEKIQIYYPSKTNDYTKLPWWIDQLASSNQKHCEDHGYSVDLDMINVNAITVKQIVDYYNIRTLFCLMIDTEGSDFKILMSIDFNQFKPLYIVFENMHLTSYHNRAENYKILLDYLSHFGYKLIGENESDTIVSLF
jgi:FkbM family methyltransferase